MDRPRPVALDGGELMKSLGPVDMHPSILDRDTDPTRRLSASDLDKVVSSTVVPG